MSAIAGSMGGVLRGCTRLFRRRALVPVRLVRRSRTSLWRSGARRMARGASHLRSAGRFAPRRIRPQGRVGQAAVDAPRAAEVAGCRRTGCESDARANLCTARSRIAYCLERAMKRSRICGILVRIPKDWQGILRGTRKTGCRLRDSLSRCSVFRMVWLGTTCVNQRNFALRLSGFLRRISRAFCGCMARVMVVGRRAWLWTQCLAVGDWDAASFSCWIVSAERQLSQ